MADQLDDYLIRLRSGLRGLPPAQVSDIVAEIGSHIRESAGPGENGVAVALRRLGPAAELAAMYRPPRPPNALTRSLLGAAGGGCAVVGYVLAGSFALAAVRKPFAPDLVGLWRLAPDSFSLRLGFGATPPPGTELLGWSIVPVGLAIALGLGLLTTRLARWGIGQLRRP